MASKGQQHSNNRGLMLVITACALVVALAAGVWLYRDHQAQRARDDLRAAILRQDIDQLNAQMMYFDMAMEHIRLAEGLGLRGEQATGAMAAASAALREMFNSSTHPNDLPATTSPCVRETQKTLNIMIGFAMADIADTDTKSMIEQFRTEHAACLASIEKQLRR